MIVELLGKFYDNHSLSIINRNLAIELSKHIDNVVVSPLDSYKPEAKVSPDMLDQLEALKPTGNEKTPPDIQVRHIYPPMWRWPISNDTKVVFIQPWEFSRVPFEWQYKFETFADAIITLSRWTGAVYHEGGLNPERLFVIPVGYNPNIFRIDRKIKKSDKYTFLFVGCEQFRKGLDILLKAWQEIFSKDDNVELIIKDTPQIYGKTDLQKQIITMQYKTNVAKITYIDDAYSDTEMANLYRKCHVIVHPYRGEGFGMPIQEAIACGTIPLVTKGGSTDDFVDSIKIESAPRLVNINDIFAGKPGDSFNLMGSHTWVTEPSIDDLKQKLRQLYESKKVAVPRSSKITTWETVGKLYADTMESVHKYPTVKRVHGN